MYWTTKSFFILKPYICAELTFKLCMATKILNFSILVFLFT